MPATAQALTGLMLAVETAKTKPETVCVFESGELQWWW